MLENLARRIESIVKYMYVSTVLDAWNSSFNSLYPGFYYFVLKRVQKEEEILV